MFCICKRQRKDLGMKNYLKRILACMMAGSIFVTAAPITAEAYEIPEKPDSTVTVDVALGVKSDVVSWLEAHEHDDYYLGTPYQKLDADETATQEGIDDLLHPRGEYPNDAHMNCTGFVASVLRKLGADLTQIPAERTGWYANASNWIRYAGAKGIRVLHYNTVEEALADGKLKKGDILYFEPLDWGAEGADCHIGFFWGDTPSENKFWHSSTHPQSGNQISRIEPKCPSSMYVFPISRLEPEKGTLQLVKTSADPSVTDGNDSYSLADAEYGVYSDAGCSKKAGTLVTAADGTSNMLTLAVGTYYVREDKAPKGYGIDPAYKNGKEVRITAETAGTLRIESSDPPLANPNIIAIRKRDAAGKQYNALADYPQGGAELEGAEYTLKFYAQGNASGTPERTWVYRTDHAGYIDLRLEEYKVSGPDFYKDLHGAVTFPLGTITVQETRAPKGYQADSAVYTGHIVPNAAGTDSVFRWADGTNEARISYNAADGSITHWEESVIRGDVQIEKQDAETRGQIVVRYPDGTGADAEEMIPAQGDASLAGIQFSIINRNDNPVAADGKLYKPGETVKIITTEAENGKVTAKTTGKALPYGTYGIKEFKTNGSYLLTDGAERTFTIRIDGETVTADIKAAGLTFRNQVVRGGIRVQKNDLELDKSEASGRAAKLSGIEFTIQNASAYPVLVEGKIYTPGETVKQIYTAWNADLHAYTAETAADCLPYGTYTVQETAGAEGYLLTDGAVRTVEIRENGKIVTAAKEGDALIWRNQVIRGDFELVKIRDSAARRLQVPFLITNLETGEKHVIVTDINGEFSSRANWTAHSAKTNANDALLAYGDDEVIPLAEMDDTAGIWFGNGEFGSQALADDTLGALPYGRYSIRELRCENNRNLILQEFEFSIYRHGVTVDLGTITDDILEPEISTMAIDSETGDHISMANEETAISDTVHCVGLIPGDTYTVKGVLMDRATGKALLIDGKEIKAETVFMAETAVQDVVVTFQFDASGLGGITTVVFEELYNKSTLIAAHKDITDKSQEIHFPEIHTNAKDSVSGRPEIMESEVQIVADTVTYQNLIPGKEYIVKGVLMNQETGRAFLLNGKEITAQKEFTAEAEDGEVVLTFSVPAGTLAGETCVVFEDLYYKDIKIAVHADIEDEDQTVYFPEIHTNAVNQATKLHEGPACRETTIADTVSYAGVKAGETYTVKGVLMNRENGKPLLVNGKEIRAEKTFAAEAGKGTVTLLFTFDSSALEGVTTVVFEELYQADTKLASHADITDKDQSVTFAAIHTNAADQDSGTHTAAVGSSVTITDTVRYTGLTPGNSYTLEGVLIDQASQKPLLVNGKEIRSEITFIAENGSGSVQVTFTLNTKNLQGKTFVIFETLKDVNGTEIAAHKDITDRSQTITVPVLPPVPPKTGDSLPVMAMGMMFISILAFAAAAFLRFSVRSPGSKGRS